MNDDPVAAYAALSPRDRYLVARRLGVITDDDRRHPWTQEQLDSRRLTRVRERGLIGRLEDEIAAIRSAKR